MLVTKYKNNTKKSKWQYKKVLQYVQTNASEMKASFKMPSMTASQEINQAHSHCVQLHTMLCNIQQCNTKKDAQEEM